MHQMYAALIGVLAGVLGGMFGIGGGIVIVPALIFLMGFSQQKAQGTSLAAFLLPVGILGFLNYYKKGEADIITGMIIGAGIFVGAFAGSKIAIGLDEVLLRKLFAGLLVILAIQLFLKK